MVCALERQGAQGAEVILILIIYINRADLPWYNEPKQQKVTEEMGLKLACFLHLSACRNRLGDGHQTAVMPYWTDT